MITSLVACLADTTVRLNAITTLANLTSHISFCFSFFFFLFFLLLFSPLFFLVSCFSFLRRLSLTLHTKLHEMMCEKQEVFATSFPFGPPRMMATLSLEKNASGIKNEKKIRERKRYTYLLMFRFVCNLCYNGMQKKIRGTY